MTTDQKIEAIKSAIEKAKNHQSKMDEVAWNVPALSSLKIRHLMNNLGAISTRYMEHGVHKGGIFSSVVRKNTNIEIAWWGDSFASDKVTGEKVQDQFLDNAVNCIGGNETLLLGSVSETFELPSSFGTDVDLYCFDADHSYESQRKAVTHFLPSLTDEFIYCCDDWDWEHVWKGTMDGIRDGNLEILFDHRFRGNDHDNDGWWNGFAVFLLKKK